MRWLNGLTWEAKKKRKEQWHRWFAWYPVTVKIINKGTEERKYKAWLETIERKGIYVPSWFKTWWEYKYRFLVNK